jgi:hypothetical protein
LQLWRATTSTAAATAVSTRGFRMLLLLLTAGICWLLELLLL